MSRAACAVCGAVRAPWSLGHAPHCPDYTPPRSARLCPVCAMPVAVTAVDLGPPVVVAFACTRCDVAWQETTEPDNDPEEMETEPDNDPEEMETDR